MKIIAINIKYINCDLFLSFDSYEINQGRIFREFYIFGTFSNVTDN